MALLKIPFDILEDLLDLPENVTVKSTGQSSESEALFVIEGAEQFVDAKEIEATYADNGLGGLMLVGFKPSV